jgi:hypothetical protein
MDRLGGPMGFAAVLIFLLCAVISAVLREDDETLLALFILDEEDNYEDSETN